MHDIFLSYAREDRERAQKFAQALERQGWSVFWDRRIPAGARWEDTIGKELHEARCVIVLWSNASLRSDWVRDEATEAKKRGVLIPVLIEKVAPPLGLRAIQAAELVNWNGAETADAFRELIAAVARIIGLPSKTEERGEEQQDAPSLMYLLRHIPMLFIILIAIGSYLTLVAYSTLSLDMRKSLLPFGVILLVFFFISCLLTFMKMFSRRY